MRTILAFTSAVTPSADVNLAEMMIWLRDHVPAEPSCATAPAIMRPDPSLLPFSPIHHPCRADLGIMGYDVTSSHCDAKAVSGAVGAVVDGDGDFLMNGQDLPPPRSVSPADHRDCSRQWHVRHHPDASGTQFPGRVIATELQNPDFDAIPAFGGSARRWSERGNSRTPSRLPAAPGNRPSFT